MDLLNDLGNDVALSILVKKTHFEKLDSKEILPLITRIREVLEPISSRNHSHPIESLDVAKAVSKPY